MWKTLKSGQIIIIMIIIMIICITHGGQNIENSPGDLRKLAITQTPVKDHQLMLM